MSGPNQGGKVYDQNSLLGFIKNKKEKKKEKEEEEET